MKIVIEPALLSGNYRLRKFATGQDASCSERSILVPSVSTNESSPIKQFESIGLSKRETEVLALVAAGKTNPQISQQLAISVKTVKKHLENIFGKLNANSRNDAVNKALQKLER
jgi:DNA-binding CsgD family transcriptional regulator